MREIFSVRGGESLIQVWGRYETALLVAGVPIAMDWACGDGSIDHYLLRAGVPDRFELLEAHRFVVDGGFDATKPLSEQFAAIMRLFRDGDYALSLTEAGAEDTWDHCAFDWDGTGQQRDHVYPEGTTYISTRPRESLDRGRIDEFSQYMEYGVEPIVVTASNGSRLEYVIDGHHKLHAYERRGRSPRVLNICAVPVDFDPAVMSSSLTDVKLKRFFDRTHRRA